MPKTRTLVLALTALLAPLWACAAQQIYRCNIQGSITYQADPCPSGERRPAPTVQQLNAERRKQLQQAAERTSAPSVAPVPSAPPMAPVAAPPKPAPTPTRPGAFRCDGRQFCSQMTSCAEATYFLNHCPDTHMDGNNDGIPCERQWCRPGH